MFFSFPFTFCLELGNLGFPGGFLAELVREETDLDKERFQGLNGSLLFFQLFLFLVVGTSLIGKFLQFFCKLGIDAPEM